MVVANTQQAGWEIDVTYYMLVVLSWLGIVWNVKAPSEQFLRNEQRLGSRVVRRTAEQLAGRFNPEQIARAIKSSVEETELSSVRDTLLLLRHRADLLWNGHLPNMPKRELFLAEARNMFPKTISLDDIVNRAYQLLVEAVGSLLLVPPLLATTSSECRASRH
jgi:stearoyl-CoA desaturase (Delta-9 desaturase)